MAKLESFPHPPIIRDYPQRTDDEIFRQFFTALQKDDAEWPELAWPRICAALIRQVQILRRDLDELDRSLPGERNC